MKRLFLILLFAACYRMPVNGQTASSPGRLAGKFSFLKEKNVNVVPPSSSAGLRSTTASAEVTSWQNASNFANDNTKQLSELLTVLKTTSLLQPSITSTDADLKNLGYILLALKDASDIEAYFTAAHVVSSADKGIISLLIRDIKDVVKKLAPPTLSVFATGDIAGSISHTGSGVGQSNTGSGSLGIQYVSSSNIVLAKVYVASTQDTLSTNFGQSLLNPGKGKAVGSGLLEWYKRLGWKGSSPWLHVYGSVASAMWGFNTDGDKPVYKKASILGAGVLANWNLIQGSIASTNVGVNLEAGLSFRSVGGDVRSMFKNSTDSAAYIKAFPTKQSVFIGPEFGLSMHVGDVTASFQTYCYIKQAKNQVEGLTGLQLNFSLSISASVISGILNQ